MTQSSPFLSVSYTTLWLKLMLSVATLVLLYFRYRAGKHSRVSAKAYPLRTKVAVGFALLLSFAVFHDLGSFRGGTFVHYAEMFHYYLGSKYFKELGHSELYNAVIVADAEQGNILAGLPFYTDLRTYKNTQRKTALRDVDRVRNLFSAERWTAFKNDVSFFETATHTPNGPGLGFLLMDHGYNASPVSSFILGLFTNMVPVTQLSFLALLDVFVVLAMLAIVFHTFGFETGSLFSGYFFVNILSGHEYISGSLLRYDWLLFIVIAVCLLEKGRHASSAFFLTLSAMLRVFPALLFYGVAVAIFQRARATRTLDQQSLRFIVATGVTALALFLLPAASFGSVVRPWQDFFAKATLHDSGVYVNHLGLRGMVLAEASQLSLERFVETYKSADVVRRWQDVKENELRNKRPLIVVASMLVLIGLTAIIWRRKESESTSVLWPLFLVYTTSYLSSYYYAFLCLFILLFFRRTHALNAYVPVCLLLLVNVGALVTDAFKPSPIVFFTLINLYLFLCLSAVLAFELYTSVFARSPIETSASLEPSHAPSRDMGRRRRQARARRK